MNKPKISKKILGVTTLVAMAVGGSLISQTPAWSIQLRSGATKAQEQPAGQKSDNDAAVQRTRRMIQMLDDLNKTAIVAITEHYVNSPGDLSAATASKVLFKALKDKGYVETRLLGWVDPLFNPMENAPQDDFEKQAKEKLLAGEATYEQVVEENGKRYLRVATAVPVVMEKCIMCHANFKDKQGAIGALAYKMPVLE